MSTINNDIPFVPENTTDPAAGLNQALNVIDALLQIAVVAIQDDPPVAPAEGQRYIVGAAGSGAWSGQSNRLARYLDGSWSFYDARYAVNLSDGGLYIRNNTGWNAVSGGGEGSYAWGSITGTLSDQADLQAELDDKEQFLTAGSNVTIDRTDPENPVISSSGGGGGSGIVETVVAGNGVSVDSTDPANPVVSATGGGGGIDVPWPGRVDSSTALTIDEDDLQQLIETTGASPVVTIPDEATDDLGYGFVCYGIHYGSGDVTFDDAGITLIHPSGSEPSVPSLSPWTLVKSRTAADTWYLFGGLEQTS